MTKIGYIPSAAVLDLADCWGLVDGMAQHAGPGLGVARQWAGMPVVLIIGAADEAGATAKGLGFHNGWLVPQATAGVTLAKGHAAAGGCLSLLRSGRSEGETRGFVDFGIDGRLLHEERTGSMTGKARRSLLAQNDGSKTPSPGGAFRCSESTSCFPLLRGRPRGGDGKGRQ